MRACVTPLLGHVSGGVNVIFVAKPEVLDAPFADLGRQAETLIRRAGLWRDEP